MLITFWDRRGIIHWKLLEKGQSMTAVLYCQILNCVRQQLRNRRIPVILLHDNKASHSKCDKESFGRLRMGGFGAPAV